MKTSFNFRNGKISRRKLLKQTSLAAVSGLLYMSLPEQLLASEKEKSKVVLIRNKDLFDGNNLRSEVVQDMLDEAVRQLAQSDDTREAWGKFIHSSDIVGIKTNAWNYLPTPPEVESAIKKRVMDCGVKEKDISINDRGILRDPVFQRATALINTRPMRTHDWSGVGTLLKNYIQFCENPPSLHPDSCADLAKTWFYPNVKGKTRLNILVMFTPMFHNVGPTHYSSKYIWSYNGLIVSADPVAADATGMWIIQAKRKEQFGEERPINPPPKHIAIADTRYHLGNSKPENIDLVIRGWKEDLLI